MNIAGTVGSQRFVLGGSWLYSNFDAKVNTRHCALPIFMRGNLVIRLFKKCC